MTPRLAPLLLLLVAAPAAAQLKGGRTTFPSPQHFAAELKFGAYSPDIDSSPGLNGNHPFSDLFRSQDDPNVGSRPQGRLLTTLELDWQIWRKFGSIGVAVSAGIMRRTTHSFQFADNATGTSCVVPNCVRSSDTTTLSVVPLTLEAVYRFDVLAKRFRVPLVPYLKAGVAYYLWWVENGGGKVSTSLPSTAGGPVENAIGGTFGLVMHPGIAFLLDVIDPAVARVMDSEIGINHSYIFFEGNLAWITGFGSNSKMVLSDTTWNAGVAFEF